MDVICGKKDFFKNPDKLPLNKLYFNYKKVIRTSKEEVTVDQMLKEAEHPQKERWRERYDVKEEKKSALDKCWIDERRYVKFQPYYPQFDENENDQFLEKNEEFLEILEHLVECTYHQFWCYIACEPCVSFIIKDFLQHSVPLYSSALLNEDFLSLYNRIYSCVCSVYERLLKFNLSETEYMLEDFALGIIQGTELLSVHSVFSLCYLYNSSNPEFINRLISFCRSDKRKESFIKDVTDILSDVLEELDRLGGDSSDLAPSSIADIYRRYKPEYFDPTWLEETSLYLLELAAALRQFLSVCEPALEIAFTLELPQRVPHIYQKIYSQMYDMLDDKRDIGYDWSRYEMLINQWLQIGRSEFVHLFHVLTSHCINAILRVKNNRQQQEHCLETYIGLISNAMDDDLFMKDYNLSHPLSVQFEMLADSVKDFDKTQTDYLLTNLAEITVEPEKKTINEVKVVKEESLSHEQEPSDLLPHGLYQALCDTLNQYLETRQDDGSGSVPEDLPEPVARAVDKILELKDQWEASHNWQEDAVESEITSNDVQQSNVDEQFEPINKPSEEEIERCIQAVLDMLPDLGSGFVLKCLERMDYRPELVISRVLDGNLPFDVQDVPQGLVRGMSEAEALALPGPSRRVEVFKQPEIKFIAHTGKKPGYTDAKQLLDDKKEKQDIKELVLKASYTYDLDDDYDDRNEVHTICDNDDLESRIYRHLKKDPEFEMYNTVNDPSSSSEDETKTAKPTNAFCEDPAVIRARRAAQRGRVFKGPGPSRDVVGRPKGQGQENTVVQNREKKTVHKSSRANHNRKGGAQWKRNKGMIPS